MRRGALVGAATILLGLCSCSSTPDPSVLRIATTSSVDQSGLLATLLPAFRAESGIDVRVHIAGSGQALQMLARGDADLAISHAPEAEAKALREHADWSYRKLAFNEFVIVGPRQDPAGARGSSSAVEAFRRIAQSGRFVSRGDQSGTHEREERLWALAGAKPDAARLIVSGRSMAQALRHADEAEAYTLADEATFRRLEQRLALTAHFRGDSLLVNTYAVLHDPTDGDAARFDNWLTAGAGRSLISSFTVDGQRQYSVWPEGCAAADPVDTPCISK